MEPISNQEAYEMLKVRTRPMCKQLESIYGFLLETEEEKPKYIMSDYRKNNYMYKNFKASPKELIMLCNTQNSKCVSLFE